MILRNVGKQKCNNPEEYYVKDGSIAKSDSAWIELN
jgi:hypothetical protein